MEKDDPASPLPDDAPTSRRRFVLLSSAAVLAFATAGAGVTASVRSSAEERQASKRAAAERARIRATQIFSADSPWNTPIPADPAIDPNSAAVQRAVLRNTALVVNTAIYAYGIPFYTATASTPRVQVKGRGALDEPVPIDPSWRPNSGGDRKMNVIDPAAGLIYELQGYDPAKLTAYWIVVRDLEDGVADGTSSRGRRGPTGSGLTQAGGVIRIAEIRAGQINHALSFITSRPSTRLRYPATHTDGTNTSAGAVEEGMRIQLDPDLDLDSLKLSRAEGAIARALQVYGAFCTDNGQGNNMAMGFYAEKPTADTGDPYRAAGLDGDWAQLRKIPRASLRVLAASVTRP